MQLKEPLNLERLDGGYSAVELAMRKGIALDR